MVRSMYSGVSGLRSHQTRMDTIGNNIANVNTYGFKSGRTTFRDIYYQTMSSASQPTAAMGGTNPSAVGYGSKVGSVDLMMGRSTFTMTDQTMDLAVDGEGFFQVQDGAGNTYYTRAGMLNFDAAGNLVDMQGNYVLGINGDPSGRAPGSERIQVTLPNVQPAAGSVIQTINGKEFTITGSNQTTDSNININFAVDSSVADDQVMADITTTGITFRFNPDNSYDSWASISAALNEAIAASPQGSHPAGELTLEFTGMGTDPIADGGGSIKASELVSSDYSIQTYPFKFTGAGSSNIFGGIYPTGVGNTFSGTGAIGDMEGIYHRGATSEDDWWEIKLDVGGVEYSGRIDASRNSSGTVQLSNGNGDPFDYITMKRPSFDNITDAWAREEGTVAAGTSVFPQQNFNPVGATTTLPYIDLSSCVPALANDATTTYDAKMLANGNWEISITNNGTTYTASVADTHTASGTINFSNGLTATVPAHSAISNAYKSAYIGTRPPNDEPFDVVDASAFGNPTAQPSTPSYNLGFGSTAFALRGGTAGGPQTIADMTGIQIATNGIITGWDSVGAEVIIGRIDLATFANAAGLNQAGSSNYTESSNSGVPQLSQPGSNGAGKLVGGSLELSNVDLSREFSDMITTQRGYQANSRIITVSDTMLEELINLKR